MFKYEFLITINSDEKERVSIKSHSQVMAWVKLFRTLTPYQMSVLEKVVLTSIGG